MDEYFSFLRTPLVAMVCPEGARQRLKHIYLRAGRKNGWVYWEANLGKSETNYAPDGAL